MPINVDRSLAKDSRGNMLWDCRDVPVETAHGEFQERQLIGQPDGGCRHRLGPGGMMIYMYNDQPGVFYNERGIRVPDSFWTGTDLEELKRKGRRQSAMKLAAAQVDEDFSGVAAVKVLKEHPTGAPEYRLVEVAPNHHQLQFVEPDGKGTPLTPQPLTPKAALKIWEELVGADSPVLDAPATR